ncbi:MAG: DUF3006 domain-containing protein [Lachnospiraceae bacterium]
MKYIIDRFEGDFAVCEDENQLFVNIRKALLPEGARPGDILAKDQETYRIDNDASRSRREEMRKKMEKLWG